MCSGSQHLKKRSCTCLFQQRFEPFAANNRRFHCDGSFNISKKHNSETGIEETD